MNHTKLFKILFIEDLPLDVDIAVRELKNANFEFEYSTVCTKADLCKSLDDFRPDLIISDYMMPSFNGLQALKIAKEFDADLPFILCTGSVNEEIAVDCIKAGAIDYVTKQHMTRLPFAVKDALDNVRISKEKKAFDLLLKENEAKLQSIFRASQVGIGLTVERIFIEVNDFFCKMTGYDRKDLIGRSSEMLYSSNEEFISAGKEKYGQISEKGVGSVETKFRRKDGKILNVILSSAPLDRTDLLKGVTFTVLDITDRKAGEEALLESQRLFQNLTQISPVGIFRTDSSGNTTYVNPKWSELSGLSTDKSVGKGWLDAVHPDDKIKLSKDWIHDFKNKKQSVAEFRFLKADGSIVWVMGSAVPEYIGNELVGYTGSLTDISFRKQAEAGLRDSEERLKILFDHAPDAYFLYDLMGNFIDGNLACEKLVGYNKSELTGKNFLKLDLISAGYLPLTAKLLAKNFLGYGTGPDVLELNRKDGSKVKAEIITHPVKIKDQTHVLGIARDISDRLRTEEAIRKNEEKYRRIFENVQDVYYETSMDGRIIEVSPSIEILSGHAYSAEDLIGKSMYNFYSDPLQRELIIKGLKEKGKVTDFEVSLRSHNGSIYPCSISAKLLFDENGIPEKIIGSMHDIADRKNASDALKLAKEKAEMSDRLKTDFLNNISHEVRTPLNGILGFAEILSLQDLSEEDKKNSYTMLFESSNRLLNTITNYMDISLITSGSLSVNKKNFPVCLVLKKLFENFKPVCLNRNLELFLEIPENCEDYNLMSDSEICRKIMTHFLDNAVKFTEKGSIHFGFKSNDGQMELFVRDTGVGINPDSFSIIFDRFVKDAHGPYGITEGSGLGLSIARGMADAIGAKIGLESEPGVGSRFSLSIPVIETGKAVLQKMPSENQKRSKKSHAIIVAEDDETNFYYLNTLLTKETNSQILHALNGEEAIELFKANPDVELILMDMKMPEMDGFEATRQIKLINQNVRIIAVTAYAMSGDEDRVMAAGCDGYLSKPINRKNLLEAIGEFIKE